MYNNACESRREAMSRLVPQCIASLMRHVQMLINDKTNVGGGGTSPASLWASWVFTNSDAFWMSGSSS